MPTTRVPALAEVDAIATLADPVVRNLQITQCYHELALVLAERTGLNANWCTFATWASAQAGRTVRKEDLGRALERLRGGVAQPEAVLAGIWAWLRAAGVGAIGLPVQELLWQAWNPREAFDRASDAVARGNRKVFDEIGRAFARFYATLGADREFDSERIARFCEEFLPGDPPDGQQYLRQAFARYYQAIFEPDPKARAELLLLANIEIGYHEQTRLQPEIREALDAPVPSAAEFKRRLAAAMVRRGGGLAAVAWAWSRVRGRLTPLDAAAELFAAEVRRHVRLITTELLMTLELPGGQRLRLGEDLSAQYPPALQHLANADLLALLARIDRTPNSLRGTGVLDWSDLAQRLHFILDMFRCYEEAQDLFSPPFTSEQIAAVKSGRRPEGRF